MDSVAASEAVDVGSIPAACTSFENPASPPKRGFLCLSPLEIDFLRLLQFARF